MRDGFRLFGKHPLPFSLLFVVFLATAVLSSAVPFIGPIVMLAALPLLSLGFMVASESALQGGPIHPGQFIAPLRGDATRRRSLLVLCVAYGALTLGLLLWSNWIDDGAFERLQQLMAEGDKQAEIEALVNEPSFTWGLVVRFGLAALLALPFWHAPALVHWGGQGPAQALFSSTLAVWRSKGAFLVYGLAWGGMVAVLRHAGRGDVRPLRRARDGRHRRAAGRADLLDRVLRLAAVHVQRQLRRQRRGGTGALRLRSPA